MVMSGHSVYLTTLFYELLKCCVDGRNCICFCSDWLLGFVYGHFFFNLVCGLAIILQRKRAGYFTFTMLRLSVFCVSFSMCRGSVCSL